MKFIFFVSEKLERLESEIAEFLRENPDIEIKFITQSESKYNFSITIFYEGIKSIKSKETLNFTKDDLRKIKMVGPRTKQNLIEFLEKQGYKLKS